MIIASIIFMYMKSNNITARDIFQHRVFKYITRALILYIFSLLFKTFDLSFPNDIGAFLLRGQFFSLMFVTLGLIIWQAGSGIAHIIRNQLFNRRPATKFVVLCVSLLLFGLVASFTFGLCYSAFDVFLYHRYEAWNSFSSWSYDLIFGIYFFYLLILSYCAVVYYYKNWKESQLNAERLRRENIQAKYDVLKTQIDPHFFFNSLSVLTNLVYKSPDLAADYITQLAKSYRYILDKKFDNLVSIGTELEFLESYCYLIKIRHQNSIVINIDIPDKVKVNGKIPPATLQMLVENAVKHNRFSTNDPLNIVIKEEAGHLLISTDLRKRNAAHVSIGVGLENIAKRYELTCDQKIIVSETDDHFTIKVPIIDHENIIV